MDQNIVTFFNKFKVKQEDDDVERDELEFQFLDRSIEKNDSSVSSSREMIVKFLDSSNEHKYDRLVREVKIQSKYKRILSEDMNGICLNGPLSYFPMESDNIDQQVIVEPTSAAPQNARNGNRKTENNWVQRVTSNHVTLCTGRHLLHQQLETRADILARRQKQIDYGKNTIGYDNYIKQVPRNKRTRDHPWTPPKKEKFSRRAFDGLVKAWRIKLHCFDPQISNGTQYNFDGAGSHESTN